MDKCSNCGCGVDLLNKNIIDRGLKLGKVNNERILCQDCYNNKKVWHARAPTLGETLYCGVCSNECGKIDQKFIDMHKDELKSVYNPFEDVFLGYDSCEDNNF